MNEIMNFISMVKGYTVVNVILLVVGFVMLIKGADIFVEGASKIAAKFNIPQIIIGLTIVAFGTSAPEAAVSISAAFKGGAGITIGNVLGSNIMNILLILGVASLVAALPVKKNTIRIEMPFVIVVSALLLLLGVMDGEFYKVDGIIFWLFFAVFFVYLIKSAKNGNNEEEIKLDPKDTMLKMILLTVVGMVLIVLGSDVTVDAASFIADKMGMSQRLIGLTIVAFGTSLPELVTSVIAAKKGKTDIAIGNIVGSNIFNILFVLGTVCLVTPNPLDFSGFLFDSVATIIAAVMLLVFVIKNKKLGKIGGITMLITYAAYFVYIIIK